MLLLIPVKNLETRANWLVKWSIVDKGQHGQYWYYPIFHHHHCIHCRYRHVRGGQLALVNDTPFYKTIALVSKFLTGLRRGRYYPQQTHH